MATIKNYTNLEQSKILAEMLPLKSADMWYHGHYSPLKSERKYDDEPCPFHSISANWDKPCWSLAALLNVLPEIQGGKPVIALDDNYITYPHISDLYTKADNLVDAAFEMICQLKKIKKYE